MNRLLGSWYAHYWTYNLQHTHDRLLNILLNKLNFKVISNKLQQRNLHMACSLLRFWIIILNVWSNWSETLTGLLIFKIRTNSPMTCFSIKNLQQPEWHKISWHFPIWSFLIIKVKPSKSHSKKAESCWSPYVSNSAIDRRASMTKSYTITYMQKVHEKNALFSKVKLIIYRHYLVHLVDNLDLK